MRNAPIFRDRYEITEPDLTGFVDEVKKSEDDVVADAVQRGRRFVGLTVEKVTQTSVKVGKGKIYFNGPRYYQEVEGFPVDLNDLKPGLQKRYVAIVAYPDEKDDRLEERDYETDAETGVKEPRQVKVVRFRSLRLDRNPSSEAVSPLPPGDGNFVTIATVLMDTGGIVDDGIKMNAAALLDNLGDVAVEVDSLNGWREDTEPKIATFTTEIGRISARLDEIGNQDLAYALAGDVAEIRTRLDLPAVYNNYWSDDFYDESQSDKTAIGYAAKVEEGLRFPNEAEAETQLRLANVYNPDVVLTGEGLMLPKYNEIAVRLVKGGTGELKLAQYGFDTRVSQVMGMARARVRYGKEFEISQGSAFWFSGQFIGTNPQQYAGDGRQYASVFKLNSGETFQVYDTGRTDPDGYKIVRLSKFWTDSLSTAYWSRTGDEDTILGYAWVETFLQTRGAWLTRLAPRIYAKPADGLLWVGICETKEARPDLDRMLVNVSQPASFWKPLAALGENPTPVPPTYLEGGSRKGLVLQTAADYSVQQVETGTDAGITGTLFYGLNGGGLETDPTRHIMCDAYYATFPRNVVEVEFEPLSLSGGIASIDITAAQVVPEGCSITWLVFVDSKWQELGEAAADVLAARPNLLRYKARLAGTPDVMPALNLGQSRVRVTRPAKAVSHASIVRTLLAPSSTIRFMTRLRNFDPAHHSQTARVLVGAGYATVETPDFVKDVARAPGVIDRTYTFNLAAAVTSCKVQIVGTSDDAGNLFATIAGNGLALT